MSWAESDKTPTLGRMFSEAMPKRLGGPARRPEEPVEQRHRDLAASLQARLEEVYLGMLKKLAAKTGAKDVCLSGGVAFNCVANGKIFDQTPFERVYVHPAAGDAGLAVGAAYYVWHQLLGKPRSFVMEHAYWGPGYTTEEIRAAIEASAVSAGGYTLTELPEAELMRLHGRDHRRRKNSGLVSGTRGMGTARARQPQHCGGSSATGNEGNPEPANQAPGNLPAVCAVDPGRKNGGVVREGTPLAVHDARVLRSAGKARQDSRRRRMWTAPADCRP